MTDRGHTRFIILAHGRTGSTMLGRALNSNPEIRCFGEIFNGLTTGVGYELPGFDGRAEADVALRNSDPRRFLSERIFAPQPGISAVGFKFGYNHAALFPGAADLLAADAPLRVVHLMRRNRLRTLVSLHLAQASGRWLEYPPEPTLASRVNTITLSKTLRDPARAVAALRRKLRPAPPAPSDARVTLSAEQCRQFWDHLGGEEQRWQQWMAQHSNSTVYFEDLVQRRDDEEARIQTFLGVVPRSLEHPLLRQNPQPLRELIANYDELRASFAGTEYEAWFDD